MAFGNNRAQKQARAHFQLAGGSTIKFRHPYLAGQIDTKGSVDEIDISACCKLEGRYFEANPNQDSARQVVLVDSSTVTICNRLLNGTITMPVIRTTGLVATGDFISALQLIKATGDNVGGLLYKTDYINGKAITKLYYGVTVQRVPDDVSEGNDVAVYNVQLLYAGWIEAVSVTATENKKKIWAVGNSQGLEAYFSPYSIQNTDGASGTQENLLTSSNNGMYDGNLADNTADNYNVRNSQSEKKVLTKKGLPFVTGGSDITPPKTTKTTTTTTTP